MKYTAGIIMCMFMIKVQAQYSVTINITGLPATPVTEKIYIAGTFNNWNPKDENFQLQKDATGRFFIQINNMSAGTCQFKFTMGSWDLAEVDNKGDGLANRVLTVQSDTSLECTIAGWKQRSSTASAQVAVIDTAFAIPQLGRSRRIWIYLPKEYTRSQKKYPVLYMHDGQNLFDDATSFAGEWGVDEIMDVVKNACIVVGIDNGGLKRMNEYNPNNTKQFGIGEGKAYLAFIVKNLKPFIDEKYRTLAGKQYTWMAGSSMGGLISFYAGLYYPDVFGALGIFSPSFFIAPEIKTQVKQLAKKGQHGQQQYYFYAGGAEDKVMATDMETVAAAIKTAAHPRVKTVVNPLGKHNEASWRAAFPAFYAWINEIGTGN